MGDRVAWVNISGSIAEEVVIPHHATVPVPDGIGFGIACAAMVQGLTAHSLARSVRPIRSGDIALVHAAAGGVGQLLVQMLTRSGVSVVATAGSPAKLELATKLGARHTIDYREFADDGAGLAARVRHLAGRGVDVAYDGVGAATFDGSLRSLRPRGLLALFGAASGQVPPVDPQVLNQYGSLYLTRPSLAHYLRDRDELLWRASEVFDAIQRGELTVQVSRTYQLDDAAQAYTDLETRRSTGKLLFQLAAR